MDDSKYFNPPDEIEVTSESKFHETGQHEDYEYWGDRGCESCQEYKENLIFTVRFKCTATEYKRARIWEKASGFVYGNNVAHLMIDYAVANNEDLDFKIISQGE